MARIRTIKPEFWTNPQVTRLPLAARLLFIGTWNFADDHGNLPRDPDKLKMQVFPSAHDADINVEPLLLALIDQGLLIEYSVSDTGERFLNIPTFTKHQVINRPSKPAYPPPDKALKPKRGNGKAQIHTPLTEQCGTEGKGRERSKPKTLTPCVLRTQSPLAAKGDELPDGKPDIETIFGYWQQRMNSPNSRLDDKRRKLIADRLESYSPVDVCRAIRGCSRDPWHMGKNERGRKFNSLELILRDAKHIEDFIEFDTNPPAPTNGHSTSRRETLHEARKRTAEAFGVAPQTGDVFDLPPEDVHVIGSKH